MPVLALEILCSSCIVKSIGDFHLVIYFTPALSHSNAVPLGQSWETIWVGFVVGVCILHVSVTVSAYLAVPLCEFVSACLPLIHSCCMFKAITLSGV